MWVFFLFFLTAILTVCFIIKHLNYCLPICSGASEQELNKKPTNSKQSSSPHCSISECLGWAWYINWHKAPYEKYVYILTHGVITLWWRLMCFNDTFCLFHYLKGVECVKENGYFSCAWHSFLRVEPPLWILWHKILKIQPLRMRQEADAATPPADRYSAGRRLQISLPTPDGSTCIRDIITV